ncbi:MAG: addiction module protein [Burkholderiales bacterium]
MKAIRIAEVLALPIADRLKLVETIWDSIAEAPGTLQLTPAQEAELDRRLEAYRKNSTAGSPWPEVRARIRPAGKPISS